MKIRIKLSLYIGTSFSLCQILPNKTICSSLEKAFQDEERHANIKRVTLLIRNTRINSPAKRAYLEMFENDLKYIIPSMNVHKIGQTVMPFVYETLRSYILITFNPEPQEGAHL